MGAIKDESILFIKAVQYTPIYVTVYTYLSGIPSLFIVYPSKMLLLLEVSAMEFIKLKCCVVRIRRIVCNMFTFTLIIAQDISDY